MREPLPRRSLLALAGAGLALPATAGAAGEGLRPIVDVALRRAQWGGPPAATACPALPPPAPPGLSLPSYYIDRAYSVPDPERLRRYQEATRPLSDFTTATARLADQWLLTRPAQPGPAACAIEGLEGWAAAGSLTGAMDENGEHQRKWVLAGLALAWLKLRHSAPGPRIVVWLQRMGRASMEFYETYSQRRRNNHHWWAAAAAAAAAVAADDRALFDRAVAFYRLALADIGHDGTIEAEMARKGRALIYHVQSLNPLVLLAEFGEANGIGLYAAEGGALHRLAARVQAGLADPAWFAERTGEAQDWGEGRNRTWTLAWAEPYHARFPNPELARLLGAQRPVFYPYFGGSPTHDFGAPRLAGA